LTIPLSRFSDCPVYYTPSTLLSSTIPLAEQFRNAGGVKRRRSEKPCSDTGVAESRAQRGSEAVPPTSNRGVYTASVSKCHCVILRAIKNRVVSRVFEAIRQENLTSLETSGLESESDFVRRLLEKNDILPGR